MMTVSSAHSGAELDRVAINVGTHHPTSCGKVERTADHEALAAPDLPDPSCRPSCSSLLGIGRTHTDPMSSCSVQLPDGH